MVFFASENTTPVSVDEDDMDAPATLYRLDTSDDALRDEQLALAKNAEKGDHPTADPTSVTTVQQNLPSDAAVRIFPSEDVDELDFEDSHVEAATAIETTGAFMAGYPSYMSKKPPSIQSFIKASRLAQDGGIAPSPAGATAESPLNVPAAADQVPAPEAAEDKRLLSETEQAWLSHAQQVLSQYERAKVSVSNKQDSVFDENFFTKPRGKDDQPVFTYYSIQSPFTLDKTPMIGAPMPNLPSDDVIRAMLYAASERMKQPLLLDGLSPATVKKAELIARNMGLQVNVRKILGQSLVVKGASISP